MKVICSRKDLYEGVQAAARAVSSRTSLPILEHLLIKTDDDKVKIAATDFEIGIECVVEAEVEDAGALTAKAKVLSEILASLPDADIVLSSDETNAVTLQCGSSEYNMPGLAPDEFPVLPELEEEVRTMLDSDILAEGIKRTAFAISSDEARAVLTGVLIDGSENGLRFVSTDTHRLSVYDCSTAAVETPYTAIVPGRAMNELARLLSATNHVELMICANQAKFGCGKVTLLCRLIEGQYPNYQRVLPESAPNKLIVPTAHLLQSVKRIEIVARENSHRTILKSENGKLLITAESGSVGRAREEVEVIREGIDIKMAFNARYLVEVLNVIDSEAVVIETAGEVSPALITPQGQDNFRHVLMPMQIE